MRSVLPGQTIGILGGGQLGRMSAAAAAHLGYKTILLCPEADPPAAQVTNEHMQADYKDQAALKAFAEQVDVVTLEFENIPTESLDFLAQYVPVRPSKLVLEKTQDRLIEKQFVAEQGIGTAPFADAADLSSDFPFPAILKTRRMGYDGKGQVRLKDRAAFEQAWDDMDRTEAILEGLIDFDFELSVIVARNPSGQVACFPTARNGHKDGILDESRVPSGISQDLEQQAQQIGIKIAEALVLEGLLAVELFVTKSGELLVNEMAPRPHNSGHWSLDGCSTSQFEQHIRAVCDLPLGDTSVLCPTLMVNLLGDDILGVEDSLKDPNVHLHLYGKAEAKSGRKMGHLNILQPKGD